MGELSYPLAVIGVMAAATILTRALPFLALGHLRDRPWLQFLGRRLPLAVLTLLVVYVLRNIDLAASPHGLPELAGVLVTVVLQLWLRSPLVSIAGGTLAFAAGGEWLGA